MSKGGIPRVTVRKPARWKAGFRGPQHLFNHAIDMISLFGLLQYDPASNTASIPEPFYARLWDEERKGASIIGAWLCFATGVECLLKAVLLKHEIPIVSNSGTVARARKKIDQSASNSGAANAVLDGIEVFSIEAVDWPWLAGQLSRGALTFLFDFDTGTLGQLEQRLKDLEAKGIIAAAERAELANALVILRTVRRNVVAHTYYNQAFFGPFNNDLDDLYLPLVNKLLDVYRR